MSQYIFNTISNRKDKFSRSAIHAWNVVKNDFAEIAADIRKNRMSDAASKIDTLRASSVLSSIGTSIGNCTSDIRNLIDDLKKVGGPLFEIVLGLTMVVGGAFLLNAAASVSLLAMITIAALVLVGILIALVGVEDLKKNAATPVFGPR